MIPGMNLVSTLGGSDATEGTWDPPVFDHRYWRITNILTGGGFLEMSELQVLEDSVNVTADATKTSSVAPDNGALADIFDGNLSTRNFWSEATVEVGESFWIKFDFGVGVTKAINGVKQGGFDTATRYMNAFSLQWSDDNSSWSTIGSKSGLTYPGNNTLSSEYILF